ncbi:hypothetical protein RRX38_11020 [Pseudomonas sp. DTU_2021_1001937_2_SI_NGA_ILE_001]|uniref:PspA/IM30 family protein n=1 Tax=Pseudomonas sp. DTU_2021_1001937_2_SI_NGA_ILE_001 TaxID=3077589 RepID=UPI0028FC11DC|nr:hypothetical protein [Pseudomonas sp. DTU_2021_1001937_2_SI_NGA_ILE_001]WNW11661.1 hypothetical protein RRX38_11020 [Pseudomonas sp. DTU_2021_1001937_2_SI_NGA_ILE_001]
MGPTWTKLLIALRGGLQDAAEDTVVYQAWRVLDHELLEVEALVETGRSSLANLMAKNILAGREVHQTQRRLRTLTDELRHSLERAEDERALQVAGEIAEQEVLLMEETRVAREYSRSVEHLRHALEVNESRLRALKKQAELMRGADILRQGATGPASSRREPVAQLQVIADTLDTIRQHQEEMASRLATEEARCVRDPELDRHLHEAPPQACQARARSVIERIRAEELVQLP